MSLTMNMVRMLALPLQVVFVDIAIWKWVLLAEKEVALRNENSTCLKNKVELGMVCEVEGTIDLSVWQIVVISKMLWDILDVIIFTESPRS